MLSVVTQIFAPGCVQVVPNPGAGGRRGRLGCLRLCQTLSTAASRLLLPCVNSTSHFHICTAVHRRWFTSLTEAADAAGIAACATYVVVDVANGEVLQQEQLHSGSLV